MRSVKHLFGGSKEKEQVVSPHAEPEGVDLREGTTRAQPAWTESSSLGEEGFTFETPRSTNEPQGLPQKEEAVPIAVHHVHSPKESEQPVLPPQNPENVTQERIGEWHCHGPSMPEETLTKTTTNITIPVEVSLPSQPSYDSLKKELEQRIVMEEQVVEMPTVETLTRLVEVPVVEEHVRMETQKVDVPVIHSVQRIITTPVRETMIRHEQQEKEVPVAQMVSRVVSVPKVVMRPTVIDFPVVTKVKKVLEIEVEQDVLHWEKRTVEEPTIEYEQQEITEEIVVKQPQLVEVPIIEEVTKELQIPITEQTIVFEKQDTQVPIVEKRTRVIEQPIQQSIIKMVPQTVQVPVVQTVVKEPPQLYAEQPKVLQTDVQVQLDVNQEPGGQPYVKVQEPVIDNISGEFQKLEPDLQGQYNIQHDANKPTRLNE